MTNSIEQPDYVPVVEMLWHVQADMLAEHDSLRSLRRPSHVNVLEREVPRPAGGVPEYGLPLWYHAPLDNPLHMLLPTQGSVTFTRGKLGRKLRKSAPGQKRQFLLTDPLLQKAPSLEYEPLHDEDLREYFSGSRMRAHLKRAGLITAEGDVLCSFQQFAQYRRYLGALHRQAVADELRRREGVKVAAQLLSDARGTWLQTLKDRVPAHIAGLDHVPDEEGCCVGNCVACQCQCRQEEPVASIGELPWRTLPWKKLKSGRRQHTVTRRWLQKSLAQLKTMQWNEELLRRHEEATRKMVAVRKAAYKKHWDLMDDKLRRAKRAREKLLSEQFMARIKRMSAEFVKAWHQPEAVTKVIDELLGNAVTSYTITEVTKMVEEVLEKLTQRISKAMERTVKDNRTSEIFVEALRRRSSPSMSQASVSHRAQPNEVEEKTSTQVSRHSAQRFEEEQTSEKKSSVRFQTPLDTRSRMPTLLNSLRTVNTPAMAGAAFQDDMLEPSRVTVFQQQAKLMHTLRWMANFLRDSVLHLPEHKLKAMKRRIIHEDYSSYAIQETSIKEVSVQLARAIMVSNLNEVLQSKEVQDVIDCLLYKLVKVVYRDQK